MTRERVRGETLQVAAALNELQGLIREKYPEVRFEVTHGEDPDGTYLTPVVDVEDTEEVFDVVAERLLELQVEQELPVFVVPVRPLERVVEGLRKDQARRRSAGRGMPTR